MTTVRSSCGPYNFTTCLHILQNLALEGNGCFLYFFAAGEQVGDPGLVLDVRGIDLDVQIDGRDDGARG